MRTAWCGGNSLPNGENIRDTGLFILLVGLLVWNAGAWLVWGVARRQNALAGLILLGSRTPRMSAADLAQAPAEYPPEIAATYLQLPPALSERVCTFAVRLTADARNPYERAIHIQNYLRVTFPYKLDVPPPPENRDAVDYFPFEALGGTCAYFASAMAVMLRTQGVPARVVSGYAMGEYDYSRGAYRVSVNAAHAWVQVYFPDYGWVEFEPTPAQRIFEYPDRKGIATATRDVSSEKNTGQPGEIALRLAGFVVLAQDLSTHARLGAALTHATALYVCATFSPRAPGETEIQTARRLWHCAVVKWLALGLQALAHSVRRVSRRK